MTRAADDYDAIRVRLEEITSPVAASPDGRGYGWTTLRAYYVGVGYAFAAGKRCHVVGRDPAGALEVKFESTGDQVWLVPAASVNPVTAFAIGDSVILGDYLRITCRYPGRVMRIADDPTHGRVYLVGWASGGYSWVLAAGLLPDPENAR